MNLRARKELERDGAPQRQVDDAEDNAHAAGTQQALYTVLASHDIARLGQIRETPGRHG